MALLEVNQLNVKFSTQHGNVHAVRDLSFKLDEGECLGLVGESGSGKSVSNLALMGLVASPPGEVKAKSILFEDRDLLKLPQSEIRKMRGNSMSMIFQDPMTSLNPFLNVGIQLSEVLEVHKRMSRRDALRECATALGDVGIPDPEKRLASYPHELSGGMRQRVMIAMALLCKPKVLIADEPTTALDVTIQAQILELLKSLQNKYGTAIIFITHDLGVIAGFANRVHVMYAGKVVEEAPTEHLFAQPEHPYTRGLLQSIPRLDQELAESLSTIEGQPPDLADLPQGCSFAPRCAHALDQCRQASPPLVALSSKPNCYSACIRSEELGLMKKPTGGNR